MAPVPTAHAAAGEGIVGDCHAQRLGPRQVLVVRAEDLDELGLEVGQVRANIATRALSTRELASGNVLHIGADVEIRITHVCEVCSVLRRYVPGDVFPDLPGRRGWLGVFLTGGRMAVGDAITVTQGLYEAVPDAIYDRLAWVVAQIPPGHITTYADLIQIVGASKSYVRAMPTYLKRADAAGLPAHRVLTSERRLNRHLPEQRALLEAEGVSIAGVERRTNASDWNPASVYFQPRTVIRGCAPPSSAMESATRRRRTASPA